MPWFCLLSFVLLCNFVYLKHWNHLVSNGSFLSASYYLRDSWVLAAFYGGKLHFQGHNLTAKENLLINEDFKINQRGQTTYAGAGYTVDGWCMLSSGMILTTGSNGIDRLVFNGTGSPLLWMQRLDTALVSQLIGSICTLTFWVENISGSVSLGGRNGVPNIVLKNGINSVTFTMKSDTLAAGVYLWTTKEASCKPIAAKLEKGACFTGFTDPDPTLELARCQRYLIKIARYKSFRATIVYPDYLTFTVPCGTMRVDPRIVGSLVIKNLTGTSFSGFTFSVHTNDGIGTQIRATKNAHGLSDAILMCDSDIFLDANM